MTFKELNLSSELLKALDETGYTTPTPIQAQAIPVVLEGKDVLGCAQTGTGKTAAFVIPMLEQIAGSKNPDSKRKVRGLIVTPTRELAIQIGENFREYGKYTKINCTVIFGGVKQGKQTASLKNGVDVIVATPGRLLDLMQQGFISLKDIEHFVLDEADRMLDMGFIHDVKKILKHLPQKRQSLFFSATMSPEIIKLSNEILDRPIEIAVTPKSSTAEIINQSIYFVDKGNKNQLLIHLLEDPKLTSVLVFTRTKHGADKVVKVLNKSNIKAAAIHGNKSQNARQKALGDFKDQKIRVLVATDIAARGIDIDELAYVINYELPNVAESYVHRIGRTGRAGSAGTAIAFCDATEIPYLKDIEKLIKQKITVIDGHPYPMVELDAKIPPKQPRPPRRNNNQGHKGNRSGHNKGNSKR
ncbi:MAG: DEAD/DEAH box helicase [Brumimicrobium sp.]|nr:DEAD/DEAH box helicase [Brumimicrobium sp.]